MNNDKSARLLKELWRAIEPKVGESISFEILVEAFASQLGWLRSLHVSSEEYFSLFAIEVLTVVQDAEELTKQSLVNAADRARYQLRRCFKKQARQLVETEQIAAPRAKEDVQSELSRIKPILENVLGPSDLLLLQTLLEGLSTREIAQAFGQDPKYVRTRKARLIKRIQKHLSGDS